MSAFSEQLRLEHALWARQQRSSLLAFASAVLPHGQAPAKHHRLLIGELEKVSTGETERLLVTMPPGAAKSFYCSTVFPAYWLANHKRSNIISASHTSTLAERFSGDVQRVIRGHSETLDYQLLSDAKDVWETTTGSRYLACGAGAGIAGFRADLAILDDIVRSKADADSLLLRDKLYDWYISDLLPRLRPDARIILIMTRWHEDDIAGRLLERRPGDWKLLRLPAYADDENDPLGRAIGEPLWADDGYGFQRRIAQQYDELMASGKSREWHALWQQMPRPPEGAMFDVSKVKVADFVHGSLSEIVRAWDIASSTGKHSDWTVGLKMARMEDRTLVIGDVVRFRGPPNEVERRIVQTANADTANTKVLIPTDPGSAGQFQTDYLARALMGFQFEASRETGDKATRASPVASQMNVGNISLLKAAWNTVFLDELSSFPNGKFDDQVDALSRAFQHLLPDTLGTHLRLANGPGLDRLYQLYAGRQGNY